MPLAVLEITRHAQKDLAAIHSVERKKIINKLTDFANNPKSFANQVKSLKGSAMLRLRIGDYRILFEEDGRILRILRVGHRKEIYR
jgi:mRNA interferase RelE/StbE